MKFYYYVGVVSIPMTPVQAACVLHMCKAGPYFRLRVFLLSVCSFWAPDRAEPLLCECVPDLQAALKFQFCVPLRGEKSRKSTSPGAPA